MQVGVEEAKENLEAGFVLFAHPNPATRKTTIQYGLLKETSVSLAIYDIQGRSVKTLVQGVQSAGLHAVQWDGFDEQNHTAGAGVYFFMLATEQETMIRKLILVR